MLYFLWENKIKYIDIYCLIHTNYLQVTYIVNRILQFVGISVDDVKYLRKSHTCWSISAPFSVKTSVVPQSSIFILGWNTISINCVLKMVNCIILFDLKNLKFLVLKLTLTWKESQSYVNQTGFSLILLELDIRFYDYLLNLVTIAKNFRIIIDQDLKFRKKYE